jgi:hypothetical protein
LCQATINLPTDSGFVVDDLESAGLWMPCGIEIRGQAEALVDVGPPMPFFSREIIRITPERIGNAAAAAGPCLLVGGIVDAFPAARHIGDPWTLTTSS